MKIFSGNILLLLLALSAYLAVLTAPHYSIAISHDCGGIAQPACVTPPPTPTPPSKPIGIPNPLGAPDIYSFVEAILGIVFRIGTVVAVFFIVYSGFLFITAQGDTTKIIDARRVFTWTIIGTAILLGSWLLATAIEGTIIQLGGG